jgi:hypothetical protein
MLQIQANFIFATFATVPGIGFATMLAPANVAQFFGNPAGTRISNPLASKLLATT